MPICILLLTFFVEYHTIALIVPAILGIFQYFLSGSYVPYFCAFYVIWMMVRILLLNYCLIKLTKATLSDLNIAHHSDYNCAYLR